MIYSKGVKPSMNSDSTNRLSPKSEIFYSVYPKIPLIIFYLSCKMSIL